MVSAPRILLSVFIATFYSCSSDRSHQNDTVKQKDSVAEIQNERYKNLASLILTADSVVIISHEIPKEYRPKITIDTDLSGATSKQKPKIESEKGLHYYDKGIINRKLTVEHLLLNDKNKRELAVILTTQPTQISNHYQCDEPRHSVLIYKYNMEFYLLLCFTCQRTHSSPRLWISDSDFDNSKWQRLEMFLQKNNLTTMLTKYK